jgi:hypothetical protein
MRAIRTSGLMSGDGKRGGAQTSALAPILDSTQNAVALFQLQPARRSPEKDRAYPPQSAITS